MNPTPRKTTTPSNIGRWLLIWINLKSVGPVPVFVCVWDGVYPRQVILAPLTHTHTERERECIFMYVHGYIPGLHIDYTFRNSYHMYNTIQDILGLSDRPFHSSNCIPIPCMIHKYNPAWYCTRVQHLKIPVDIHLSTTFDDYSL